MISNVWIDVWIDRCTCFNSVFCKLSRKYKFHTRRYVLKIYLIPSVTIIILKKGCLRTVLISLHSCVSNVCIFFFSLHYLVCGFLSPYRNKKTMIGVLRKSSFKEFTQIHILTFYCISLHRCNNALRNICSNLFSNSFFQDSFTFI